MKYVFALMALWSAGSMADDIFPGMDKEDTLQVLCHPGSKEEKAQTDGEKQDTDKLRKEFFEFLKNPSPQVVALEKGALFKKDGGMEPMGNMAHFSNTCYLAHSYIKDIRTKGCFDRNGKKVNAEKAAKLCAPLVKRLEKQRKDEAMEANPAKTGGQAVDDKENEKDDTSATSAH